MDEKRKAFKKHTGMTNQSRLKKNAYAENKKGKDPDNSKQTIETLQKIAERINRKKEELACIATKIPADKPRSQAAARRCCPGLRKPNLNPGYKNLSMNDYLRTNTINLEWLIRVTRNRHNKSVKLTTRILYSKIYTISSKKHHLCNFCK